MTDKHFIHDSYLIRKKFIKLVGASFHIFNANGQVEFYVKQKGFKLKEEIKVYTGEDMTQELIYIQARNVIDISAVYDVYDSFTNQKLGSLKRKGLKSIVRDQWLILDTNDNEVGNITEDSLALALIRRFLTNLVPQTFIGIINQNKVFEFKQRFNIFIQKINLDFSYDKDNILDRRLGIAAGILLCAIEGRQN